jgi:ribosomal protein S27AE
MIPDSCCIEWRIISGSDPSKNEVGFEKKYLELKLDGAKKAEEEDEIVTVRFWVIDIFEWKSVVCMQRCGVNVMMMMHKDRRRTLCFVCIYFWFLCSILYNKNGTRDARAFLFYPNENLGLLEKEQIITSSFCNRLLNKTQILWIS